MGESKASGSPMEVVTSITKTPLKIMKAALKSAFGPDADDFGFVNLGSLGAFTAAWLAFNPKSSYAYLMSTEERGTGLSGPQSRAFQFEHAIILSDRFSGTIAPAQRTGITSVWTGGVRAYRFQVIDECMSLRSQIITQE
jgi:hypothetical protein